MARSHALARRNMHRLYCAGSRRPYGLLQFDGLQNAQSIAFCHPLTRLDPNRYDHTRHGRPDLHRPSRGQLG